MFKEIKVGSIDYASGQIKNFDDFVLSDLYQDLSLRVNLSLVISGGTTSGTPVVGGSYGIIKNLYVILGGKTIKSIDGAGLRIKNFIDDKKDIESNDLSSGNAGTYAINCNLEWNFESEFLGEDKKIYSVDGEDVEVRDKDITTLNPNGNTLAIKIEWGTTTDLITGGDRTLALTGTLDVVSRVRDDVPIGILKVYQRDSDIQISAVPISDDYRKKLPQGGVLQRLLFKFDNDTDVSQIRIYANDSTLLYYFDTAQLKGKNKHDNQIDLPSGWFLLDFNPAGDIDGGIDSDDYSKIEVSLKLVAQSDVEIYIDDIIEY